MRELATHRTNLLLTPTERKLWASEAASAGISLTEYIRRSVTAARTAATPEELTELDALAAELPRAAARMAQKLDAVIAQLDYSLDPARDIEMHQRVAEELKANPPLIDWNMLGVGIAA